jgi:hypothetical protein
LNNKSAVSIVKKKSYMLQEAKYPGIEVAPLVLFSHILILASRAITGLLDLILATTHNSISSSKR